MAVFGVNTANLGHVIWVFRLQEMYSNAVIEQPVHFRNHEGKDY